MDGGARPLSRARCDYVFLGTDEGDADAHRLYERFGFSHLTDPAAAPADASGCSSTSASSERPAQSLGA